MTSLHYVTSTDPDNYGTVKYSITPVVSQPCQVRVSGIQYTANFSITTTDDFITVEDDGDITSTYQFKESTAYYSETITSDLPTALGSTDFTFTLMSNGCLEIDSDKWSEMTNASHRAKLLLGLYTCDFPLTFPIKAPSVPMTMFGNILYLKSNLPSPIGIRSNKNKDEEYPNVVYKGSDFLYPNIPVNSRTPGPVIITKTDNLTDLEFQLVDFQMEPIILHSPLTVTIEIFYGIQSIPMLPTS